MMKTIVIGAGMMGASVAYRLAQAGAAVTVLEGIGGGTSGISFAWTNAHQKPPKPYHDLNVAPARIYPEDCSDARGRYQQSGACA